MRPQTMALSTLEAVNNSCPVHDTKHGKDKEIQKYINDGSAISIHSPKEKNPNESSTSETNGSLLVTQESRSNFESVSARTITPPKLVTFHITSSQKDMSIASLYASNEFQTFISSCSVVSLGQQTIASKITHLQSERIRYEWVVGRGTFGESYCVSILCPCCMGFAELQEGRELPQHSYGGMQSGVTPQYVVKRLPSHLSLDSNKRLFLQAATDIIVESNILAGLNHPNIIKIKAVPAANTAVKDYFYVMECLQETLAHRIYESWAKSAKRWTKTNRAAQESRLKLAPTMKNCDKKMRNLWEDRITAARDLASALAYLHGEGIMHRDIKPKNIGFDSSGKIKLFDFGTAVQIPSGARAGRICGGRVGSTRYMAPEVYTRQPYALSADVYSFTLVLWEMLSFCKPPQFNNSSSTFSEETVKNKALDLTSHKGGPSRERPFIPSEWPTGIRIAISLGWSFYAQDRLSAYVMHNILGIELNASQHIK